MKGSKRKRCDTSADLIERESFNNRENHNSATMAALSSAKVQAMAHTVASSSSTTATAAATAYYDNLLNYMLYQQQQQQQPNAGSLMLPPTALPPYHHANATAAAGSNPYMVAAAAAAAAAAAFQWPLATNTNTATKTHDQHLCDASNTIVRISLHTYL